jgi:hypothetical protein
MKLSQTLFVWVRPPHGVIDAWRDAYYLLESETLSAGADAS